MVRIRSKIDKKASTIQDSQRKRKLVENGKTPNGSPSSVNLRSSKRARTSVLPYQAPDSVDALTKLTIKSTKVEETPKRKAKSIQPKTKPSKKPVKTLKRLQKNSPRVPKGGVKTSVRRKILLSPEPIIKKTKKSSKAPAEKVKVSPKAKKDTVKPRRKSIPSQDTPKKQRSNVQNSALPKKRKLTTKASSPAPKTESTSEKGKKKIKSKKGKTNPRPDLTSYEVDPLFESNVEVPFISTLAHSRLLIRAVILNDLKLLKKLVQDEPQKIYTLCMRRSIQNQEDVMDYVLKYENKEAFNLLHKLPEKTIKKFGPCPGLMLSREQTGYGSTMMFGHALRQVSVGRGGKEGNDAFLYDSSTAYNLSVSPDFRGNSLISKALEIGASPSFVTFLSEKMSVHSWNFTNIHIPLRKGHNELVGIAISKANKSGGYGFNFLHEEVLTKTKASELTPFKPVSVIKKCIYEPRFSPLHCAAINPNVEILTALIRSMPDYNLADRQGWTVGHYAAVCSGPEPLKYLLQFGISTQAVTSTKRHGDGYTLLHAAVFAGRVHNVETILQHEEKVAKENPPPEEDVANPPTKKPSKALIQNDIKYKLNTKGQNALHMACALGHGDIVQVLLQAGMDTSIPTPAKYDRVTPLMIASMFGHLDIVKILVENGVKVEAKDKRGRTAAHYAAMNGHTHVLSYLLRLGVNHLAVDTSGNTLLHYAAAYGWYFATMLCLEVGCPPNATNNWKMTPMAIAFMKGHTGLVSVLIKCEGVDVNARIDDSSGRTLLLDICRGGCELERLKFLIEDLKADPKCEDFNRNNALHFLATNEPAHRYDEAEYKKQLKAYDACIAYLVDKGCDPFKKNVSEASPILVAAQKNHFQFISKLLALKIQISFETDAEKNTLLHFMAPNFIQPESLVHSIFNTICIDPSNAGVLKKMANTYNISGLTPLLSLLNCWFNSCDESTQAKVAKVVEIFLGQFGVDVNAQVQKEDSKRSALHLSVDNFLLPTILKHKPFLNMLDAQGQTALVIAVLKGNQKAAEKLIDAGADVNFKFESEHNIGLLLYSTMKETTSFYLIEKLISRGANPKEVHPRTKNSILHYIARKPTLLFAAKAIEAALNFGVDPNLINCDGRTALHLVVNARGTETDVFYDIEDALISAGAKLSIRDSRGRIPLHYAFVKIGKPTDTTFFDPIELVSHLVTAMKSAGATRDIHVADVYGSTALHYSAFRGATICSSFLIQTLPVQGSIDASDNNGNTPFGLAVRNKHEGCALNFHQKDADFLRIINNNIKIQELRTEESTIYGSHSTSKTLSRADSWMWEIVEKKKEENERYNEEMEKYPILEQVVKHDWQGLLYLMIGQLQSSGIGFSTGIATALKTRRFKLALKLSLKVKRKQELTLESGTLFHTLAKYYNGNEKDLVEKICEVFWKSGLNTATVDEFGSEPIIYALINKQIDLCHILLKNEVDIMKTIARKKPDLFGRTPFTAIFWNLEAPFINSGVIQTFVTNLMAGGANPNQLCEFPIELTSYAGSRFVKRLINIIPSNGPKYPALILAVISQCYITVKWLLTQVSSGPHQIDVNVQDSEGRTALMHAVRLNDCKMVKLLLDPKGYDVSKDVSGKKDFKLKSSSSLNPCITDNKGWTVMDHLILSPGHNCYHKNVEQVLKLLNQIGALNVASRDGTKPIDRAAKQSRGEIVSLISTLTSIPASKRPLVADEFPRVSSSVLQQQDSTLVTIKDFSETAEVMAKNLMEKELQELKEKGEDDQMKIKPDPLCGLDKNNAEVMIDANQNIPYDCLMTKVDLNYGVHGLYNFYKMQLVKQPRGKEMILLFTQWGRVGQQGQFQKTPFATEEEAIKEFTKIFKAKSGNAWEEAQNFVPVPTKYRLVKKDLRKVKHSALYGINFKDLEKFARESKSSQARSTLTLIRNLSLVHENAGKNYKTRYHYGRFASEANFDNLPLLPIDILLKAEDILKGIGEKIKLKETMDSDYKGKYSEKDKIETMNDIAKLSENFYEIIPVYGYATEKLEPIFFDHDLRSKLVAISQLTHLELAKSFLLAAQYNQEKVNPWEYIYRCLGTKIQLLDRARDRDLEESNIILQYIHNTGEKVKVQGIYRVDRQGETERLNACGVKNRQLLWHGTSAANMLAILNQGLQVAPLGSQISGHLFGKGIYLADCFKKSQHYCRTINVDGKQRKFMLLCEAALGDIYEVKLDEAGEKPMPHGSNCLKTSDSRYEPDPESTVIWEGRTVALGKPKERVRQDNNIYYGLDYNEYIIFNVDQIAIRYLIEFED